MTRADNSPELAVDISPGFLDWLASKNISLAMTTYSIGQLIFLGVSQTGRLWLHNRKIGRCLGFKADETGFWLSSESWLYRFENMLSVTAFGKAGEDALYIPRTAHYTGDLDIHDVGILADSTPVFVNTLFSCLARPALRSSFDVVWTPPFITELAAEDRCHLNGLAMKKGKPAYMTAISSTNTAKSWRNVRRAGGVVLDIYADEAIICRNLSMPHSPRWYRNRLWLHNSGQGAFGYLDEACSSFQTVSFLPGYLRGLDFIDNYAIVGLSLPRESNSFTGLDLDDHIKKEKLQPECAIYVIDLETGQPAHSFIFRSLVREIYDVGILHGVKQPVALSPEADILKRTLFLPAGV